MKKFEFLKNLMLIFTRTIDSSTPQSSEMIYEGEEGHTERVFEIFGLTPEQFQEKCNFYPVAIIRKEYDNDVENGGKKK